MAKFIQDSALFKVLPSVSNDDQPRFFHQSRGGNWRARFSVTHKTLTLIDLK